MIEVRQLLSEDFDDEIFIRSLLDMEVVGYDSIAELKEVFEKRKVCTETYIAIVDGKIVGVAALMIHYSFTGRNLGVPMDVYVYPEYRRQGIGRKLVEAVTTVDRSKVWRIFGPVGVDLVPLYEEFGYTRKDVVYMERKVAMF